MLSPVDEKAARGREGWKRRGGALWCNAGSGSGRSLLCGGELECDSCLSDGVVFFYIGVPPPRPPPEVMLQCEQALGAADFCRLVWGLFLVATRVTYASSSSERRAGDALRRIHIQTNTHTHA